MYLPTFWGRLAMYIDHMVAGFSKPSTACNDYGLEMVEWLFPSCNCDDFHPSKPTHTNHIR